MEFDKNFFEASFSRARMKPYFDRYPENEQKAIRHYEQNIRLAESLEPSLSIFEVTLRNSIIRELERKSGRKDWYEELISSPLNSLRRLRNRVFHNENISWSIVKLEELHSTLLQVIYWMNPQVNLWMTDLDRFGKVTFKVKCQWYGWAKVIFSKDRFIYRKIIKLFSKGNR